MVRWRTLQKTLITIIVLTIGLMGRTAYAHQGALHKCDVHPHGHSAALPKMDAKYLTSDFSAVAEFTFHSTHRYWLYKFQIAINGVKGRLPMARIHEYARWERRNGEWVLSIDLGRIAFGNETFAQYASRIQKSGRKVQVWLNRAKRVKTAHVYFMPTQMIPAPKLAWEVKPPSYITNRKIDFKFSVSDAAAKVECRLDAQAFSACSNVAHYRDIGNGSHSFTVRAYNAKGVVSSTLKHGFYAWYVAPAVEIVKAIPAEEITSVDSMQVFFKRNWNWGRTSYVECRLDSGAFAKCESPKSYAQLAEGPHRIDVRLVMPILRFWRVTSEMDTHEWTIERKAIVAEWVSTPADLTRETTARFEFEATGGAVFTCALDNGNAMPCQSPHAVNALNDGLHVMRVVAADPQDASVNVVLEHRWQVDTQAPQMEMVSVMPQQDPTSLNLLSLSFTVSEPAAVQCRLDGGTPGACASPVELVDLADGRHELALTATDAAGNVSETMHYDWTVDLTLPTVTIEMVSPSSSPTRQTTATFRLVPSETAVFRCSLDGVAEMQCGTDVQLADLADGEHLLEVTPIDLAGNFGRTESFRWTVDTIAPELRLIAVNPSENPTRVAGMDLRFEASEMATMTCELDAAGAAPCASPFVANGLADGTHEVVIRALDLAGNASSALRYQWAVDTTAPALEFISAEPGDAITPETTMTIAFNPDDAVQVLCRLDNGNETACVSPVVFTDLFDGVHTAAIVAVDALGNRSEAATYSWEVKAPPLAFISVTVSQVTRNSAVVRWTTNAKAHGYVEYGPGNSFSNQTTVVLPDATIQQITLTGLRSDTFHRARVNIEDPQGRTAVSQEVSFSTLR